MLLLCHSTIIIIPLSTISIKCLFTNKPHLNVHCEPCLLKRGVTHRMVLDFRPTQIASYEEKIEFEVNGLSKTSITVKGEGVPMKVYN